MSEQLIDFILAVSTVYFQSCFFCLAIKTTTMSSHSCCAQLTCVFCFHDLVVDLLFVQRRFDNGFEHFASQFRSWGWIDQDQPWKIPPHHHLTTHSVYLMKPCSELQIPLGFFIFKVDNWTNKTMSKLVIVLSLVSDMYSSCLITANFDFLMDLQEPRMSHSGGKFWLFTLDSIVNSKGIASWLYSPLFGHQSTSCILFI